MPLASDTIAFINEESFDCNNNTEALWAGSFFELKILPRIDDWPVQTDVMKEQTAKINSSRSAFCCTFFGCILTKLGTLIYLLVEQKFKATQLVYSIRNSLLSWISALRSFLVNYCSGMFQPESANTNLWCLLVQWRRFRNLTFGLPGNHLFIGRNLLTSA